MLPDGSVVAGRFRILGTIGVGPAGVVYRADDRGVEGARKVVDADDEAVATAMLEAARRARAVRAPGVCSVVDAGRDGGSVWIASELAPGRSLAAILEDSGRLEPEAAVEILIAVCRALDAAH